MRPKLNPNSTLKYALKKVERAVPNSEGKPNFKGRKIAKPSPCRHPTWHGRAKWHDPARPGRATSLAGRSCWVLGARPCTHEQSSTVGQKIGTAWPCWVARPGRASWHGRARCAAAGSCNSRFSGFLNAFFPSLQGTAPQPFREHF